MTDKLQKGNGSMERAINELEKSSSNAIAKNTIESEETVDALIQRRQTLLSRLFPDPVEKEKQWGELQLVKTEFEFRTRALKVIRETQIQSIQEIYNQYLVQGKAQVRANTTTFMLQKRQELQDETNELFTKFIQSMQDEYDKAASIRNPTLKNMQLDRLDKNIAGFKELAEQLVKNFENIISEAIKA